MRLVNVIRINKFQAPEASLYDSSVSRRKALLGNLPKLTTQEMMCVCCGRRVPFTGKIPVEVKKVQTTKSVKPKEDQKKNVKTAKPVIRTRKNMTVFAIKFLIFLVAMAVLAYFAYQYKDVLLTYWQTANGIVGKIEKLVEKARELVGNMKELLGKFR